MKIRAGGRLCHRKPNSAPSSTNRKPATNSCGRCVNGSGEMTPGEPMTHESRIRIQGKLFGEIEADPDAFRFGVMPGEARGCIGCHEDAELTPENWFVDALKEHSVLVGKDGPNTDSEENEHADGESE